MSFHACGGNVGDNAEIPLPPWVMQVCWVGGPGPCPCPLCGPGLSCPTQEQCNAPSHPLSCIRPQSPLLSTILSFCPGLQVGEADPDIFFTDRPRRTPGQRNRECLTLFADEEPALLKGRSPLQCYTDFMR